MSGEGSGPASKGGYVFSTFFWRAGPFLRVLSNIRFSRCEPSPRLDDRLYTTFCQLVDGLVGLLSEFGFEAGLRRVVGAVGQTGRI